MRGYVTTWSEEDADVLARCAQKLRLLAELLDDQELRDDAEVLRSYGLAGCRALTGVRLEHMADRSA